MDVVIQFSRNACYCHRLQPDRGLCLQYIFVWRTVHARDPQESYDGCMASIIQYICADARPTMGLPSL